MPFALANELHQLQPVDVGHVDVGDHEIVAATRQQAERVEAADRLDDLELAEFGLTLQSGAYEPPGGERIVYDQNARHGGPGLRAREREDPGTGQPSLSHRAREFRVWRRERPLVSLTLPDTGRGGLVVLEFGCLIAPRLTRAEASPRRPVFLFF